jgi:hypothetical protein
MNKYYSTTKRCLEMLRKSSLQPVKKLRIELQLIEIKRLLLEETVVCELCKDEAFEDLFLWMERICEGDCNRDVTAEFMEWLGSVMNMLAAASPACCHERRSRAATVRPAAAYCPTSSDIRIG